MSLQTIKSKVHPQILFTNSKYLTIQIECDTNAQHKTHIGNKTWEHETLQRAYAYLPLFQEFVDRPVEFHHSVTQSKLIMSLSISGTASKIKSAVQKYIKTISHHLPTQENTKILICTGDKKITFEGEESWAQQHIVVPFAEKFHAQSKKTHTYSTQHSKFQPIHTDYGYQHSSKTKLDKLIHRGLYNLAGFDYFVNDKNASWINVQHQKYVHLSDKKQEVSLAIDISFQEFLKDYLKGSEKGKEKKIGSGIQILASSAALTIDELKTAQKYMEQIYRK